MSEEEQDMQQDIWEPENLVKSELEIMVRTMFLVPFEGSPVEGSKNEHVRWGAPLMIWGPPGIGKSRRVNRAAQNLGMHFEKIYAFTIDPTDIGGMPMPDREKYEMHRVVSLPKLVRMQKEEEGVLFLDEFSDSPPAVMASMQGFILDAEFGEHKLPNRVRFIMAGNTPDCSTTGWRPSPAMANRLCHVLISPPSAESWAEHMMGVEYADLDSIDKGEADVVRGWSGEHMQTLAIVTRFIKSKGSGALHALPEVGNDTRWKGWASPRSWEVAARVMTTAKILGTPKKLTKTLVRGCVGPSAEKDLYNYIAKLDLPSPEAVLDGAWDINPNRLDQAFVAYSSVGSYIKNMSSEARKENATKAWEVVKRAETVGMLDLAYGLVDEIGKLIPHTTNDEVSAIAKNIYARFAKENFLRFKQTEKVAR